jgi:hypothetical protein
MVLRAAGARGLDLRTLRTAVGTRSVWTVDLAHLLARFGGGVGNGNDCRGGKADRPLISSIILTTIWAGANPAYAGEAFYAATLEADRTRVVARFAGAPEAGVAVQTRRVPSAELGARLADGRTAIIALVDKGALARGVVSGRDESGTSHHNHRHQNHSIFRLGAVWGLGGGGGRGAEASAAPPPPTTPDRRPRESPSGGAPSSPPSPPPLQPALAAGAGRASPRLAVRRRLSTTTTTSSGGGPAPLASASASPEPSSTSDGGYAGDARAILRAAPPLPAGCGPAAGAPCGAPGSARSNARSGRIRIERRRR